MPGILHLESWQLRRW